MGDVWPMVHTERAALIDDLAGLTDGQWASDVVAHLVDNAMTTRLGILGAMVRAGFDFDRQNARGVARERAATPGETLARLRRVATRTTTPPAPLDSRLVEEVVHGEDIRRPLGITRVYPAAAVVRSLSHQARTSVALGGAKQRISAVRLSATDQDIAIGDGPEVSGPALALLLAISGRTAAFDELSGPGLASLR